MKKSRIGFVAGLVALAIFAGSCDALFTNQFKVLGLGQVTSEVLSDAVVNGDVSTIIQQSGFGTGTISPSFIEAVTASADTTQQVLDLLQETIDDPETPPEQAEAAQVLAIEIQLEASGAKAFIDNIVNAIASIDLQNFDISNPASLNTLLNALFPPKSVKTLPEGWTRDEIAIIIDTLIALDDDIAQLVGRMVGQAFLNQGVDAGWLAQVGTLVTVLKQLTPSAFYPTTGYAIAALIDEFDPDTTDPYMYINIPDSLMDDLANDPELQALFAAAGMDLQAIIQSFGG
ncbi:MAG TPA: hypothetical protein VIO60_07435 [Rectinemataceae bacterium]